MGLLGTQGGHFFRILPPFVDKKSIPGTSVLPQATFQSWLKAIPTVLIDTPNGVWAILAVTFYFLFPYDLSPQSTAAKGPITWAFFLERFPLWLCLTFGYTGFWHVTLYFLGWAERPFIKNRVYNIDKVCHNLFWATNGVVIWVLFENVFAFLWATGRLAFMSDTEAKSSVWGMLRFLAALMFIPIWRDFHFYFAHRFLHFGPLYAQVHSLHHRNTDIEPFSGLCMHPIEHVYYYACVLPSLVLWTSPFAFLWNGVHLLLAPGASHSGWEDHFQADTYHYLHHRYFSCNFAGANAAFLDTAFNTFCERLNDTDKEGARARPDAKSTLRLAPTLEFVVYLLSSIGCLVPWVLVANQFLSRTRTPTAPMIFALAFIAGFGPVLLATLVNMVTRSKGGAPNPGVVATLLQVGVGTLFCSWPVFQACSLALSPA